MQVVNGLEVEHFFASQVVRSLYATDMGRGWLMGGEGVFEDADEGSWQGNVVDAECISKEWCHLFVSESGNAASDARHEKHLVGV